MNPETPQPSASAEFIPEKISINTRRQGGRRRGGGQGADAGGESDDKNGDGQHGNSAISSSVVFHEDCDLFDEIDELYPHDYEGGKIVSDPHSASITTSFSRSDRSDFIGGHQGGADAGGESDDKNGSDGQQQQIMSTSQMSQHENSAISSSVVFHEADMDMDSLVASSNDGTLAELIAGIEGRYNSSTTMSQASGNGSNTLNHMGKCKRDSIVGGKQMSDLSFKEQRELVAPERSSRSLVVDLEGDGNDNEAAETRNGFSEQSICYYSPTIQSSENNDTSNNVIVSSVDWSSLSKSCKRAKNAFRDADSGQMVVKNMFLTHLSALTAVLTLYAKRFCGNSSGENNGDSHSPGYTLDEIMARTKETKRALRFAMSCLTPPRVEEDTKSTNEAGGYDSGSETQDGIERYRNARRYRQELQEAAVKGLTSSSPSPTCGVEKSQRRDSHHHYGLQISLGEIINADNSPDAILSAVGEDVSSVDREKRTVRVLAARMLCNLVTDNALAAEIVLRDVPFSPDPDLIESQLASSILGSRDRVDTSKTIFKCDHKVLFWSDLLTSTAKVQSNNGATSKYGKGKHRGDDHSDDREALAAVAAALHNLLTSLEARESLLELDDEMKRREAVKKEQQRQAAELGRQDSLPGEPNISEIEVERHTMKPIDVGFEVASNGPLLNALLRNILSAKAVLMQPQFEREHVEKTRPKFKPPASAAENMSDSATEWISLVLERLASRGLLPNMLQSAGGAKSNSVTPEQVVLASCIRQAVDDYHSALTSTGETGGFGRRRLSIAAKAAGMTVATRPHPLWGREDLGAAGRGVPTRDSRTAVPIFLSLANEVEEIRLRSNALREGEAIELYDGEANCTLRIIDDLCDILAQCLGRHASSSLNNNQSFIADARSVLGRETSLIADCCKDLGRVLDSSIASNSGRKAREMMLSPQDQQTAIVMVRMIGNLVFQCQYNQDLLRITPIPIAEMAIDKSSVSSNSTETRSNLNNGAPVERTGLHVILSATSLAPACFTLREWCIVAIRNAVEGNAANAETVRRLEANEVLDDTPELQRIGVKIDMDANGNVKVKRRDS